MTSPTTNTTMAAMDKEIQKDCKVGLMLLSWEPTKDIL